MARPKRKELKAEVSLPPSPLPTGGPTWEVQEKLRFWCPLCGMVADVDRLAESPYPVRLKLQRYGGRLPGGIGYMEYVDVDEIHRLNLIKELARKVEVLPEHLATELEAAPTAPETFAEWVEEARKRWPHLEREYDLILHALSLALRDVGVSATPDELHSRFTSALPFIRPSTSFTRIAALLDENLRKRIDYPTYLPIADFNVVTATLSNLSTLIVPNVVEQGAKKEIQERKLRKGTAKYRTFIQKHAAAWIAAERENFEAAKARALAEIERVQREWEEQAQAAATMAEVFDKDLDIVTGAYTLAGQRVPEELLTKVAEAVEKLGRARSAVERLEGVKSRLEALTFEEYMEKYQQPILKEAWEWLQGGRSA